MEFDSLSESIDLTREQKVKAQTEWGGQPVYIPKMTKDDRDLRNDNIKKLYYDRKMHIGNIASMMKMSVKQIRRIVREK